MDFFVREAWAQDAAMGGGDTTAMLVQFGPLILIFAIFYFLIIRPQQKRQKGAKSCYRYTTFWFLARKKGVSVGQIWAPKRGPAAHC